MGNQSGNDQDKRKSLKVSHEKGKVTSKLTEEQKAQRKREGRLMLYGVAGYFGLVAISSLLIAVIVGFVYAGRVVDRAVWTAPIMTLVILIGTYPLEKRYEVYKPFFQGMRRTSMIALGVFAVPLLLMGSCMVLFWGVGM